MIKTLIHLGENCAYDTEFFTVLAQKRSSPIPMLPFVIFNILMGLIEGLDLTAIDSFMVGFDFIKKEGLVVLNPVALLNCGRLG